MRARIYLVLFLLLVVLAGSGYACSEAMRVREVVVLGCEERDPAQVVDLAGIQNEESIFRIKFSQVEQSIDADPYFDVESIRYIFPDKLRIQGSERKTSAAVSHLGSVLVVDETGFVLEIRQQLGDLRVPVVTGLRITEGYQVGETLVSSQASQLDAMHAILTQLREQNAIQLISEINLDAVSDLWMTTVSGFEVRLGNFEDMENKIRWLRAVEPILVSEGYTGGIITVSTGESASFLDVDGEGIPLTPEAAGDPEGDEPGSGDGDGPDVPEDAPEDSPQPADEP